MRFFQTSTFVFFLFFVLSIHISKAQEVLFFDMFKTITKDDAGFPKGNFAPEKNNCNWVSPVDYTSGKIYIRIEGKSAPTEVCIRSSFAIWQLGEAVIPYGARPEVNITPDPDEISLGYGEFNFSDWKYIADTAKWDSCRSKMGPVIKSCDDKFISPSNDWEWGGKNPDEWYPMQLRFTMIVVAEGYEFSGWDTYIGQVTGIEVDEEEVIMDPENAAYIKAEVFPSDANMKGYTVESLNTDIVEVKDEVAGRIWSKKPGQASVVVRAIDGNFTDTCIVYVSGQTNTSVQGKDTRAKFTVNNPATANNILIKLLNEAQGNMVIQIFDLSGKCVWGKEYINKNSIYLNLEGRINTGIYFVKVSSMNTSRVQKLIIE